MRRAAAGRRGTNVVVNPVDKFALANVVTNVVGSKNRHATTLVGRDPGTINAGAVTGTVELIGPGAQVQVEAGRQPAPIFDVEENNGARGEAFRFGGGGGIPGIEYSLLLCLDVFLDLVCLTSAIESGKSESLRLE